MAVNFVFIIFSLIFSKVDILEPWENYNCFFLITLENKTINYIFDVLFPQTHTN